MAFAIGERVPLFQVSNAMDLSTLVQKIQEERSAVALNIFLKRSATDDLQDLQKYVTNGMDIRRFTLIQVLATQFTARGATRYSFFSDL